MSPSPAISKKPDPLTVVLIAWPRKISAPERSSTSTDDRSAIRSLYGFSGSKVQESTPAAPTRSSRVPDSKAMPPPAVWAMSWPSQIREYTTSPLSDT